MPHSTCSSAICANRPTHHNARSSCGVLHPSFSYPGPSRPPDPGNAARGFWCFAPNPLRGRDAAARRAGLKPAYLYCGDSTPAPGPISLSWQRNGGKKPLALPPRAGVPGAALASPLRRGLRPCVRGVLRNGSLTPRYLRHARTGGIGRMDIPARSVVLGAAGN